MATITQQLLGFLFNAPATTLGTAPWKDNVAAVYGFNAAGDGYQVFKPTSKFNSLTQLVPDGHYILASHTLGYDLPGAGLVRAGELPATPLSVTVGAISRTAQTGNYVDATVHDTAADSQPIQLTIYAGTTYIYDTLLGANSTLRLPVGPVGPHHIICVDSQGQATRLDFAG